MNLRLPSLSTRPPHHLQEICKKAIKTLKCSEVVLTIFFGNLVKGGLFSVFWLKTGYYNNTYYSILFYFIVFYTIIFYYILLYSILLYSILFYNNKVLWRKLNVLSPGFEPRTPHHTRPSDRTFPTNGRKIFSAQKYELENKYK